MSKIYGYCRVSTQTQSIDRQIRNIKQIYPESIIIQEAYTGTRVEGRKQFQRLLKAVKDGDTIIFDSVSRMSRNADDGIRLYFELYNKNINLIFLKEHYIDTDIYRQNTQQKIQLTGTEEDILFSAINNYFIKLAEKQIKIAFEQAQKEVDDLHIRTKEGIETARLNGKQIGQQQGASLHIKKKEPIKAEIKKKSKDFNGTMTDKDLIKILGIARNTYYKYKKEMIGNE